LHLKTLALNIMITNRYCKYLYQFSNKLENFKRNIKVSIYFGNQLIHGEESIIYGFKVSFQTLTLLR